MKTSDVIALFALLMSGASLWLAWSANRETRALQRPILAFDANYALANGPLGITLRNSGASTATIVTFREQHRNGGWWSNSVPFSMAGISRGQLFRTELADGTSLATGERISLFSIAAPLTDVQRKITEDMLRSFSFAACYCTADAKDCWELQWQASAARNERRKEASVRQCQR